MGGCQNYGPVLGPYYNTAPIIVGYPKRDLNVDNYPCMSLGRRASGLRVHGFSLRSKGFRVLGVRV